MGLFSFLFRQKAASESFPAATPVSGATPAPATAPSDAIQSSFGPEFATPMAAIREAFDQVVASVDIAAGRIQRASR